MILQAPTNLQQLCHSVKEQFVTANDLSRKVKLHKISYATHTYCRSVLFNRGSAEP